jgi:hypothetical protein
LARIAFSVALATLLLLPLAAMAGSPDWDALAGVETIEVITHDEAGEPRETTIWLAVLDGQGFIRTGGSAWGKDTKRDPRICAGA